MTNKKTNYNIKYFSEYHKELTEKWYPNWKKQIMSKIPSDYLVTDDEIDSHITYFCIQRAKSFKLGHYPSYCNAFIVKDVVRIIWSEYHKLDHSSLDRALEDFENDYENSYTESHYVIKASLERSKTEFEKMQRSLLIEDIKELAPDKLTKDIIECILEGIDDLQSIGKKTGVSKDTVARRLKALRNKLNENH